MIHFLTIVRDGMPWLALHYPQMVRLRRPWRWWVVEGAARGLSDTDHCRLVEPGLSRDGTTEYLRELSKTDNRVRYIPGWEWPGKTAMCNAAVRQMQEEGWLWQVDADELWTAEQWEQGVRLMEDGGFDKAFFMCRYYVGPDRYLCRSGVFGNKTRMEWLRLWRFRPPQEFITHEPPKLASLGERAVGQTATREAGLVFRHMAYVSREQVAQKEAYYQKEGVLAGWERLQKASLPCDLHDFWPGVPEGATVQEDKGD